MTKKDVAEKVWEAVKDCGYSIVTVMESYDLGTNKREARSSILVGTYNERGPTITGNSIEECLKKFAAVRVQDRKSQRIAELKKELAKLQSFCGATDCVRCFPDAWANDTYEDECTLADDAHNNGDDDDTD